MMKLQRANLQITGSKFVAVKINFDLKNFPN